jgi:hypothetical protein
MIRQLIQRYEDYRGISWDEITELFDLCDGFFELAGTMIEQQAATTGGAYPDVPLWPGFQRSYKALKAEFDRVMSESHYG